MPKFHVVCRHPNASTSINGVRFEKMRKGGVRTAEPVDAEIADQFRGIPHYEFEEVKAPVGRGKRGAEAEAPQPEPEPVDAEIADGEDDDNAAVGDGSDEGNESDGDEDGQAGLSL